MNPSILITPNGVKAGKLYSIKPTDGSGDLDVVRATTATRVNSDGLIESVGVNVPRLDYSNGSCPSILVEPQRTNLLLRSEELNVSPWGTLGTTTIMPNSTIAPDGNNTADLITGVNSASSIYQLYNSSSGVVYTFSIFIKNNNSTQSKLLIRNASTVVDATLNWTGSVLSSITNTTGIATFQSYNNGWYRIMSTYTSIENIQRPRILPTLSTNQSVFIWGAQLEAGSNATSYIPTVASAVTRNLDQIYKSSITSLLGQTEGTIFSEVLLTKADSGNRNIFLMNEANGAVSNLIRIRFSGTNIQGNIFFAGAIVANITYSNSNLGKFKIALSYKDNYCALFVNGVKVGEDLSLSVPPTNLIRIGSFSSSFEFLNDNINICAHWKNCLTDQQCIELTTL